MLILMPVETFPVGFPRVACFLDSDDSFMLFKRFGIVFSRLLLNKQDEIREMEDELQGMDKTYEANGCEEYLRSRNEGDRKTITSSWTRTRPELLEKLETKILQYCILSTLDRLRSHTDLWVQRSSYSKPIN